MKWTIHPAKLLLTLVALPALLIPALALGYIVYQGGAVISWQFISTSAELSGFGASSGVFSQLAGSLLLAVGACIVATPVALGTALFYQLSNNSRLCHHLELLIYLLQAVPPIVYGLFGLILFVQIFSLGVSLIAGMLVLAMVLLPMLTLNNITSLQRIAIEQTDAARALGLTESALVLRVWLRQSRRELITGQLLAIARALSETAPILFTATVFSGVVWPDSLLSPVTTLQTHIFYLAQEGNHPQSIDVAWGSALVLVITIVLFSLLARALKPSGGNL